MKSLTQLLGLTSQKEVKLSTGSEKAAKQDFTQTKEKERKSKSGQLKEHFDRQTANREQEHIKVQIQ